MAEFMRAGGVPIWIVLLFSIAGLIAAAMFAAKPSEAKVSFIRSISIATVFAIASGVSANLATVMVKVPMNPEWSSSPKLSLIVMTGIGESLTPAILGFTLLAVIWLVTGVGLRRLGGRLSAELV